jgi:hypothetical protein
MLAARYALMYPKGGCTKARHRGYQPEDALRIVPRGKMSDGAAQSQLSLANPVGISGSCRVFLNGYFRLKRGDNRPSVAVGNSEGGT